MQYAPPGTIVRTAATYRSVGGERAAQSLTTSVLYWMQANEPRLLAEMIQSVFDDVPFYDLYPVTESDIFDFEYLRVMRQILEGIDNQMINAGSSGLDRLNDVLAFTGIFVSGGTQHYDESSSPNIRASAFKKLIGMPSDMRIGPARTQPSTPQRPTSTPPSRDPAPRPPPGQSRINWDSGEGIASEEWMQEHMGTNLEEPNADWGDLIRLIEEDFSSSEGPPAWMIAVALTEIVPLSEVDINEYIIGDETDDMLDRLIENGQRWDHIIWHLEDDVLNEDSDEYYKARDHQADSWLEDNDHIHFIGEFDVYYDIHSRGVFHDNSFIYDHLGSIWEYVYDNYDESDCEEIADRDHITGEIESESVEWTIDGIAWFVFERGTWVR